MAKNDTYEHPQLTAASSSITAARILAGEPLTLAERATAARLFDELAKRRKSDHEIGARGRGARTERREALVRTVIAEHRRTLLAFAERDRATYVRRKLELRAVREGVTGPVPGPRLIRRVLRKAGLLGQTAPKG